MATTGEAGSKRMQNPDAFLNLLKKPATAATGDGHAFDWLRISLRLKRVKTDVKSVFTRQFCFAARFLSRQKSYARNQLTISILYEKSPLGTNRCRTTAEDRGSGGEVKSIMTMP
jgi:hypothetical protein